MKTLISILILAAIFPSLNQAQTARHSRQQIANSDQSKVKAQRRYDPLAGHTHLQDGPLDKFLDSVNPRDRDFGALIADAVSAWSSRPPRIPISGSHSESRSQSCCWSATYSGYFVSATTVLKSASTSLRSWQIPTSTHDRERWMPYHGTTAWWTNITPSLKRMRSRNQVSRRYSILYCRHLQENVRSKVQRKRRHLSSNQNQRLSRLPQSPNQPGRPLKRAST